MYLQWKCPLKGAIWVTLGRFDWFWWGDVEYQSQRVVPGEEPILEYRLTADGFTNKDRPDRRDRPAIASNELPTWTKTLTSKSLSRPLRPVFPDRDDWDWQSPPSINIAPFADDDQVVMLQFDPHVPVFVPQAMPAPADPTIQDAENLLGRKLVPIRYNDQDWWATYTTLPATKEIPYFRSPQVLAHQFKLAKADLAPTPPGKECWFLVSVAPFCWPDRQYWGQFTEPLTGLMDRSLAAYRAKLKALLPGVKVLRPGDSDASVWVIFPSTPGQDVLYRIASLYQTFSIRRVPDSEPRIPPLPDEDGDLS
jgi:hypothetical protein